MLVKKYCVVILKRMVILPVCTEEKYFGDVGIFDVETLSCFPSPSLFFVFYFPASTGLWEPYK